MTKYAVANVARFPCVRQIYLIFSRLAHRSAITCVLFGEVQLAEDTSTILHSSEKHVHALSLTDTRASLQSRYTFFLSFFKYVKSATSCSSFSPRELASVHCLLLTGYVCYSFEVEAFFFKYSGKEGRLPFQNRRYKQPLVIITRALILRYIRVVVIDKYIYLCIHIYLKTNLRVFN